MEGRGCSASKIKAKLPASPVPFDCNWRHLSGICLALPKFDVAGNIDVLLCVDVLSRVLSQGQWQGPPGFPMALDTSFGWVLSGTVKPNNLHYWRVSRVSCTCMWWDVAEIGETRFMTVHWSHCLAHLLRSTTIFKGLHTNTQFLNSCLTNTCKYGWVWCLCCCIVF